MDLSLQEIFIKNLKFYRKAKGLTQETLSEKIGNGLSYISKVESKVCFPPLQTIEKIATKLEIQPYQLFCDKLPQEAYSETIKTIADKLSLMPENRVKFINKMIESLNEF